MTYQNFIYLTEELKRKQAITMEWEDCTVSFQMGPKNDLWMISSQVSHSKEMAEDMQSFLEKNERTHPTIRIVNQEKKELLFVKNFQRTNRYTLFRRFMKNYLEEAKGWRMAFDPMLSEEGEY